MYSVFSLELQTAFPVFELFQKEYDVQLLKLEYPDKNKFTYFYLVIGKVGF